MMLRRKRCEEQQGKDLAFLQTLRDFAGGRATGMAKRRVRFSASDRAVASTRLWEKKSSAKPASMAASAAIAWASIGVGSSAVCDRPHAQLCPNWPAASLLHFLQRFLCASGAGVEEHCCLRRHFGNG